jgi:chromosomal replication initiation ATPase DnaA
MRSQSLHAQAEALSAKVAALRVQVADLTRAATRMEVATRRLTPGQFATEPVLVIKVEVASHFGLAVHDLECRDRHEPVAWARAVAMHLCRQLLPRVSTALVGLAFGRDHSTVTHACRALRDRLESEPHRRGDLEMLAGKIRGKLEMKSVKEL